MTDYRLHTQGWRPPPEIVTDHAFTGADPTHCDVCDLAAGYHQDTGELGVQS